MAPADTGKPCLNQIGHVLARRVMKMSWSSLNRLIAVHQYEVTISVSRKAAPLCQGASNAHFCFEQLKYSVSRRSAFAFPGLHRRIIREDRSEFLKAREEGVWEGQSELPQWQMRTAPR